MSSKRLLYGGAISVEIPSNFLDTSTLRPIPDNQEVFIHPIDDISIIFELLEMEPEEKQQCLLNHFEIVYDRHPIELLNINQFNQPTERMGVYSTESIHYSTESIHYSTESIHYSDQRIENMDHQMTEYQNNQNMEHHSMKVDGHQSMIEYEKSMKHQSMIEYEKSMKHQSMIEYENIVLLKAIVDNNQVLMGMKRIKEYQTDFLLTVNGVFDITEFTRILTSIVIIDSTLFK